MFSRGKIGWVFGLMWAVSFVGRAEEPAVKVTAIPKTTESERKIAGNVAVGEREGFYKISVKNPSFTQTSPMLNARYHVFVRRDDGMKNSRDVKPQRVSGEVAVPAIKPGESAVVPTAVVKLKQTSLDSNFYYTNMKRSATRDELVGVWVRIYEKDKMVAEYKSSSTLAKSGPF